VGGFLIFDVKSRDGAVSASPTDDKDDDRSTMETFVGGAVIIGTKRPAY